MPLPVVVVAVGLTMISGALKLLITAGKAAAKAAAMIALFWATYEFVVDLVTYVLGTVITYVMGYLPLDTSSLIFVMALEFRKTTEPWFPWEHLFGIIRFFVAVEIWLLEIHLAYFALRAAINVSKIGADNATGNV